MKKNIKLFFLLTVCILFSVSMISCGDDKKEGGDNTGSGKIEFSVPEVEFSSESSSYILEVTADDDWGVTSGDKWCTVSPGGGIAGKTAITIRVETNSGEEKRSTALTFKSGSTIKELAIIQDFKVREVAFADDIFKRYCVANFDTDGDGLLSLTEAATVTDMSPKGLGIVSMVGLEAFTSLRSLDCSGNQIAELDMTKLHSLEKLNCSDNLLSELSIETNINLKELNAVNNPLTVVYVWTGFTAGGSFVIPADAAFIEPEIPTPMGYRLVWQDEFNDLRDANGNGVLPNTDRWWYETGGGGWGNREIQEYIAGVSGKDTCAVISDGALKIIAKKTAAGKVYSIRMNTNESWTYGYFEARLKLPGGKGTWPAFWMMPKNYTSWPEDGEIDIMEEVGVDPNVVHASIHCKAYYHSNNTQKTATITIPTAETGFNVYALEWTPDFIKAYANGVCYYEFYNDHTGNYDTWPFDNPFYLKLNLAWGGDWGGYDGVNESALPAVYEIDYVRVFQKD